MSSARWRSLRRSEGRDAPRQRRRKERAVAAAQRCILSKQTPPVSAHLDALTRSFNRPLDDSAIQDAACSIFESFSDLREEWQAAVAVAQELDCLLSLAQASAAHPGCRTPEFVPFEGHSVLELRGAVHPCLYEQSVARLSQEQKQFVSNDIVLGYAVSDGQASSQPARQQRARLVRGGLILALCFLSETGKSCTFRHGDG